jgi:hypothetical protein
LALICGPVALAEAGWFHYESLMKIDLPYLGDRNYVHGTTIVDLVLSQFQPGFPLEIKFQSPILGAIELLRGQTNEKPNVAVSFEKSGKRVSYGLFDAGNGRLDNRVPFNESAIASSFNVREKSIRSPHKTDVSLISRVVVMNKVLMARVFPAAIGKWWFAGLAAEAWPNIAASIELEFDGGLGTKLARSIIKVDDDLIGKIYFSLSPA